MNNQHKGEVEFEVDGVSYVLRRSWNSICELEGLTGRGFYTLSQELASWGPPLDAKGRPKSETKEQADRRMSRMQGSTLRAVFCAMLRDRRPDTSLQEAGELIDQLGIEKVLELIMTAFERGTPSETKGSRPPMKNGPEEPTANISTLNRSS